MLIAILTPLLLLSETRIKESVESTVGGCILVLNLRAGRTPEIVEVVGYMAGKAPTTLDLTFQARHGLINLLEFKNGILVTAPTPYSSLVLHPKAGQVCPGALCLEPREIREPAQSMTIRLPNPSSSFDYLFSAHLSDTATQGEPVDERLAVYSIGGTDQTNVCRVEPANIFNLLVRLDKAGRFAAYCLIIFGATVLLIIFKAWRSHDVSQKP